MGGLRGPELLLVFAALLLLFGASRLPRLGVALGETLRSLKQGLKGHHDA